MAVCAECGKELSSGEACSCAARSSGAGSTKGSAIAFALSALLGIIAVAVMLTMMEGTESANQINPSADFLNKQKKLDAIAKESEALAAMEKQKEEEQRRLRREEVKRQAGLRWSFFSIEDKMSGGMIHRAEIKSKNAVNFSYPYGNTRATLEVRNHPRHGNDVIFSVNSGQFVCSTFECEVDVRFGKGRPTKYLAAPSSDHDRKVIFIKDFERFVSSLSKSESASVEATFYQDGVHVFEFDISGFEWPL